ncbi:hypothetical protein BHE18_00105 [Rossellomorea aquimaris]|uniref:Uncharacterized protein n=1 Tax=Rossellomorea aquimaris TaxID=189382 RepID=A0A1J6WY84_9BACI|nr:hypothetical protein BHE18_00105 [Rossellomorea aquimaris]
MFEHGQIPEFLKSPMVFGVVLLTFVISDIVMKKKTQTQYKTTVYCPLLKHHVLLQPHKTIIEFDKSTVSGTLST